MRADLHVHTCFSCDSKTTMEDQCVSAIQKGLDVVCFTEHVDCNPQDYGYGFYRADAYFQEVGRLREKFADQLEILNGLEFSEPHIYRSEFEKLQKLPYDFIIGSLHYWVDDLFPSEMVKKNIPIEKCYDAYWKEMRTMVEYGGFDSVGHIDFPKRYYHGLLYEEDCLRDIFQTIVQKGLIIEINTSSLRKGLTSMLPEDALLQLYREQGGKFVTLGTDAHCCEDLAANLDDAEAKTNAFGLKKVIYRKRKQIIEI